MASYITMNNCASTFEYIALRLVQQTINDIINAYNKANKLLVKIKSGVDVVRNKERFEVCKEEIEDLESYFETDVNGIFNELDIDSEELYKCIKYKLGLRLDDIPDIPEIDESALEQAYEIIVGKNGQYTFVFS